MLYKNGTVFIDGEFREASFRVEDGYFSEISYEETGEKGVDLSGKYVIPGLVDVHLHGSMGADFSDGDIEGVEKMARYLASQGVTGFAPTTMTLPYETIDRACQSGLEFKNNRPEGAARLMGIHMEGPFFSDAKKGAQNGAYLRDPDFKAFKKLYNNCRGLIRIVDLAPERPGSMEFIREAKDVCTVSVGHTDADYDTAREAFESGAKHVTHLYNGMPSLHHRKPGVIAAASENDSVIAEMICDGYHIHPAAIRAAYKMFPGRICLISDSLRCCGMPDGEYELGGQMAYLKGGVARLADGTIAGSASSLYTCMLRAISFGIPREQAILSATLIPAREIREDDEIGAIEVGKRADFVVCTPLLERLKVYIGGKSIE